ncbi:ribose/proton symporter RbsU [Enterococcus sp.]|uniref:ribose/proton symporter RbsU n=1 Tax=Enterococcus sp. TaxID=35783 RepID=UPI002FC7BD47
MNTTALLIGLCPVIGWGFFPTVASKIGGRPVHQIFGTTLGAFIFALIVAIATKTALPTGGDLILALFSGVGWALAQILTFQSFALVGASKALPVTTAFQLLGASLWGVIFLGNWPSTSERIMGGIALILIIFGASLTVWMEKKNQESALVMKKAILILAIGEIGYLTYSAAPQATTIDGMTAFLPQTMGMLLVAIIYGIVTSFKGRAVFTERVSYGNIASGFLFAFAALTYLISAQPNMNGLATGFVLSQVCVVVGTLTSIWFLKQRKTKKEMRVTLIGLSLIIFAAALTVMN